MDNLIIETYKPERDISSIRTMLRGDEYFEGKFQEDEMKFPEGIFVAYYNSVTVGFLSFSSLKGRGTETTIFVSKEYRRMGIGSKLIERAEQLLNQYEAVERSMGACIDGDRSSLQFMCKNGYHILHSSYIMVRKGENLPESHFPIRQYEDDDYLMWHGIREMAFYKMRERVGILPSYYYAPSEWERKNFLEDRNNRFVLLVNSEMAAVGVIDGSELRQVAVRPDMQSRGYGRGFVSFLVNEMMHRGEKIVKLEVVKGNPAKTMYESLGFKEKSLHHIVTKYYRPDSRLSRPPDEDIL
ncbi:GNAT family N-acetyltransferase [Paenibacillus sp. N3/727]|uniref:GNAT family N-acetyltransferase n=1 Tax=Paenibacillus sp. N3/727 TaxID=2925845 RepID=UPI001F533C4D|nr:GNAT family N-acetyltransferase [Paenibacillus sp. N3/727]UNK17003.1 GNAT family N-acetyltransferase [Paenibacillus sp. N3/727]